MQTPKFNVGEFWYSADDMLYRVDAVSTDHSAVTECTHVGGRIEATNITYLWDRDSIYQRDSGGWRFARLDEFRTAVYRRRHG